MENWVVLAGVHVVPFPARLTTTPVLFSVTEGGVATTGFEKLSASKIGVAEFSQPHCPPVLARVASEPVKGVAPLVPPTMKQFA